MDFVQTRITGAGTDEIFGADGMYPFSGNLLAETTLRYISLKKNGGSIENLSPIRICERYNYSGNDSWNDSIDGAITANPDCSIFVITASRGYDGALPIISKEGFESTNGWRIPVASVLSGKTKIDTSIYINREQKKVVVFVKRTTNSWIDLFCSLVFLLMPWLYGNNCEHLDETEQKFFRAINNGDSNTFTQIVSDLCKDIDFGAVQARAALKNWGSAQREAKIRQITESVTTKRKEISDLEKRWSEANAEMLSANETLAALLATAKKDDPDEFYNFFKSRHLHYIEKSATRSGGELLYAIVETIENYDRDDFLRIYNNPNSYLHNTGREKSKKILYAIFAEEKAKFRTECVFRLRNLSSVTPVKGMLSGYFNDTLPHPHLYEFECLGQNAQYILKFMESGDWDMAIDQTIQAAKNLNFGDTTVVGRLADKLFGSYANKKIIIRNDGTNMSPNEFLAWLETEEAKKEEQGGDNNG